MASRFNSLVELSTSASQTMSSLVPWFWVHCLSICYANASAFSSSVKHIPVLAWSRGIVSFLFLFSWLASRKLFHRVRYHQRCSSIRCCGKPLVPFSLVVEVGWTLRYLQDWGLFGHVSLLFTSTLLVLLSFVGGRLCFVFAWCLFVWRGLLRRIWHFLSVFDIFGAVDRSDSCRVFF